MECYLCLIVIFSITQFAECHFTCHLSEDSSSDHESVKSDTRQLVIGPPGKQGPRGLPGDLNNCNCSDYSEAHDRIKELEETIEDLKKAVACKGVVFENTCIRLLKTIYDPVDYTTASNMCSFHGGKLADVTTDKLFYEVYNYVLNEWNSYKSTNRDYVHVRLGMKYLNGAIVTSSGRSIDPSSIGFWHTGCPCSGEREYMSMLIAMNQVRVRSGQRGFYNTAITHSDLVPLCQFPL